MAVAIELHINGQPQKLTADPARSLLSVLRDDLTLTATQRYFITPKGHFAPRNDPWGFSSLSRDRSETQLNITYQF